MLVWLTSYCQRMCGTVGVFDLWRILAFDRRVQAAGVIRLGEAELCKLRPGDAS